jgi:GH24 family phage-related lysozyme (muramidase)
VAAALPNCDKLSPDSLGAIVSLAYNRGASFGPGRPEMHNIYNHMVAQQFDKIPAEFVSMTRLWPKGGDLYRRRLHEAELFKAGLVSVPAVVS